MPSVQVPCFAIRIGTMSSHPLDLRLVVVACHLRVPKTSSQGIVIWLQTAWNGLQLRRCKKKHIAFQCSKIARIWAQLGNHHDQKSMKIDGELGAATIIPWISEWRVFFPKRFLKCVGKCRNIATLVWDSFESDIRCGWCGWISGETDQGVAAQVSRWRDRHWTDDEGEGRRGRALVERIYLRPALLHALVNFCELIIHRNEETQSKNGSQHVLNMFKPVQQF